MKRTLSFMVLFILLLAFSPQANADDTHHVAMTKQWVIKFNTPVDTSTVQNNIYVINENAPDKRVALKEFTYANGNKHVIVTPNGTYRQGDSYQLIVTNGVKSTEGNSLKASKKVRFTVENGCEVLKNAKPNSPYAVKIATFDGDAAHLGACTTSNGTSYSFNYSYANAVTNSTLAYEGESDGYYFINSGGRTMAVDKSVAKKVDGFKLSYYEVKNNSLYHSVYTANDKYEVYITPGYPDFLKPGAVYSSYDGSTFTDKDGKVVGTAYNYFQFISIRTKTNYTADELNRYIENKMPADSVMQGMGEALIKAQDTYNLNALFMLAFAAHESQNGTSTNAKNLKNIYSLDLRDINPSTYVYTSVEENLNVASEAILEKYLKIGGVYANGALIGNNSHGMNVKFATDPYWGEGIAGHMNQIDLYLGSKDKFSHKLGIIDSEYDFLNIRNDVFASQSPLYRHVLSNGRGVTIIGEKPSYYELLGDYGQTPGIVTGTKQYINEVVTY
ncbi:MAG: Ig-like domain-containing protein [Solibacillus sp.]